MPSSYTGVATSTLLIVFLVIKSADDIYIFAVLPLPNIYIRECSRNLPTILVIVILSV